MDYDSEISALAAETIALQSLFVGLAKALKERDPTLSDAVSDAFDYAETIITVSSMKSEGAGHTLRASEILETLRSAVL